MFANPDDKNWLTSVDKIVPRETLPGGGITVSPSGEVGAANRTAGNAGAWGAKMPLKAIPKAEQKIADAKAQTGETEGSFLGLYYSSWRHLGVYGLLAGLFFMGVWGLLGSVNAPQLSDAQRFVTRKRGKG